MKLWAQKQKGFTIVELLIVIVVIAILAAITIVAFNGIQQRARNSQIIQGVTTYEKAIRLYQAGTGHCQTALAVWEQIIHQTGAGRVSMATVQ